MRDFRRLLVWQRSHKLVLDVYLVTKGFPRDERFGLTSQMRRSAASIPCNIAEGAGRSSRADYSRFLDIALASLNELEYQTILTEDLGYAGRETVRTIRQECVEIRAMLLSLRRRVISDS